MRDGDIRAMLRQSMLDAHLDDPKTRIIDEFCISGGDVRVDIAVLNGCFTGIEIKSEFDNLNRLPKQETAYSAIFDYAHLVCAEKHLDISRKIVPSWWTISTPVLRGETYKIIPFWVGCENPEPDASQTLSLLWREELLDILKEKGLAKNNLSKPKDKMCEILLGNFEGKELRDLVREKIKVRDGWRLGQPRKPSGVRHQPVSKSSGFLSPLFPGDSH